MNKVIRTLLLLSVLLAPAAPGVAGVFFQCPTLANPADPSSVVYDGVFLDRNGNGMIRADECETGACEIINPVTPRQVCIHLTAGDGWVNMADGREQYIFGFANATGAAPEHVMMDYMMKATFPAPTIRIRQGDEVYLSLTNVGMAHRPDLFDPHSVHWHGFPNAAAIFDGVPEASLTINMGASLTYYYNVQEAGTFMYHCHVEATEHMQMGMLGNLYVTSAQDDLPDDTLLGAWTHRNNSLVHDRYTYNDGDGSTRYDVDYPIQIAAFDPAFHEASRLTQPLPFALMDDRYPMLNGRGYPDTVNLDQVNGSYALPYPHGASSPMPTLITAAAGERILLRLSSLSTTSFHTLSVLGIPMQVVGKGSRKLGPPGDASQYYATASVTLGGGEAIDVILDTTGVPAGTYFLYTTNLDHLSNDAEDFGGMMTEIRIQ